MRKSTLIYSSLFALSLLWFASEGLGQQIMIQGRGIGDQEDQMRQQFMDQLANTKKAAEARLQSRIGDIERACELTGQQQKKFEVAAKGAVKAYMVKQTKQVVEMAKQMGFDFDPNEEPEDKGDEDEAPNNANGMAFAIRANVMGMVNGNGDQQVDQEKVWRSSVDKILDDGQSAQYQEWVDSRKKFQRQSAVASFIAKVDRSLLLSPEQREKLTEVVDKEFGEKLMSQAEMVNRNVFFAVNNFRMNGEEPERDNSLVEGILTESQLEQWNSTFGPQLDQMAGVNMAMPAINLMPAAANVWVEEADEDEEESDDDN